MKELTKYKASIDLFLNELLNDLSKKHHINPDLYDAICYVLGADAKRIRPSIILYIAEFLNVDLKDAMIPAASLELIHNYTLVHDDLPAMDNDAVRRGMPTCHVKFGEGIAILAGNALLTFGLELVTDRLQHNKDAWLKILQILLEKSGCVLSGQAADIKYYASNERNIEKLLDLYYLKTATFFEAAFMISGILADISNEKQSAFNELGRLFGLLYQIADDIEDNSIECDAIKDARDKLMKELDECISRIELMFQDKNLQTIRNLLSEIL